MSYLCSLQIIKKAIREGEPFEHKDCHACSFGKMWDYRASREYLNRAYAKAYRTENHVKSQTGGVIN
ncbi:hypothetical protein [Hydrogenobacter thermophilus]|uniref:hypothetical protein n=1 Tax=Hydrogenobacter thermophilus TaxID=940 RepID=UPI0026EA1988|nr:hypothetical protein [Hydrogenobacter thermophilus]